MDLSSVELAVLDLTKLNMLRKTARSVTLGTQPFLGDPIANKSAKENVLLVKHQRPDWNLVSLVQRVTFNQRQELNTVSNVLRR